MLSPAQVAALENFLSYQGFEYYEYDHAVGVVIYRFTLGEGQMQVAFGDVCYYCVQKEVASAPMREEFTRVAEVMTAYNSL